MYPPMKLGIAQKRPVFCTIEVVFCMGGSARCACKMQSLDVLCNASFNLCNAKCNICRAKCNPSSATHRLCNAHSTPLAMVTRTWKLRRDNGGCGVWGMGMFQVDGQRNFVLTQRRNTP